MNNELLAHLGEIITIGLVGWRILRKITQLLDIFREYPPHRHINGKVIYPKDYEPSRETKLATTGD